MAGVAICASADMKVHVTTKSQKKNKKYKRHHPSTPVPKCSFVKPIGITKSQPYWPARQIFVQVFEFWILTPFIPESIVASTVCRHKIGVDNGETTWVPSKPSSTSFEFPLGLSKFNVGISMNVSILQTPKSKDNCLWFERKMPSLLPIYLKYLTWQHPKLITHKESWASQLSNGTRVWGYQTVSI